jgi:hypothetical protein
MSRVNIVSNSLIALTAVSRSLFWITLTALTDVKCHWTKAEVWSVNRKRVKWQKSEICVFIGRVPCSIANNTEKTENSAKFEFSCWVWLSLLHCRSPDGIRQGHGRTYTAYRAAFKSAAQRWQLCYATGSELSSLAYAALSVLRRYTVLPRRSMHAIWWRLREYPREFVGNGRCAVCTAAGGGGDNEHGDIWTMHITKNVTSEG